VIVMLFRLFVVASLVMGISHTVTKERLFEPLRARLGGKTTWLGYLFSCPYCASHWVAFVIVPLTDSYYVQVAAMPQPLYGAARWFLASVFVATVAAYMRVLFYLVDVGQGLMRRVEHEVEDRSA